MSKSRRAAALIGLVLAGCAGSPRAFHADNSIRITSPVPMAVVSAPFTLSWTDSRTGDATYAVFVDQPPVPPGHSLRDLADTTCKHRPGCPDPAYLASHNVYLTAGPSLAVPTLPVVGSTPGRATHPTHTATVVVLDNQGHRRGDAAWSVEFRA